MNNFKILLLIAVATMISSYSNTPIIQKYHVSAIAYDELSNLKIDLKVESKNQFYVHSPDNFKSAEKLYNEDKKFFITQKNVKLSSDRAKIVSDYLISNNIGKPLNIKSFDYDYQIPLGTNKTVTRRAQSRRADALITSENI